MPRKAPEGWTWLQVQIKNEEKAVIDQVAKQTGRSITDLTRGWLRSLIDSQQEQAEAE